MNSQPYKPPYLAAGIATAAVWALYAFTLAPTTAFWDASEYIATAHMMGIPHPPGNPLFVVLARAWELLLAPFGLSVAVRINLFSATMSALAHGFWFLLVYRILSDFSASRVFRLVGASAAVLVSASAFTVWNQSNVNEKVYTVSLLTIALLSWLAFLWRDHLGEGKDDNLILLMIFILALSVGNHLMAFLAAPALVVFILLVEPRTLANWKLYAFGVVVAVIGLSVHLYLPLRAALDPVINEADPSTMQALMESLGRKQYDKPSMFVNPTDPRLPRDIGLFVLQIVNYLQYFDWQWARSIAGTIPVFGGVRPIVTVLFGLLGVYGAINHWRRDRISFAYFATLLATLSLGLVFYLNFKYGYSIAVEQYPNREMHEVRERDYFFIVSFSLWGLWAGIGIAALWQRMAQRFGDAAEPTRNALLRASPLLAIALIPLVLNWSWASRRNDYAARDWAYNLLMSVEPYGVLFTNGDNDTFPLWYLQEVEGIRRDVTVIVMSYLNTPWYAKQLRDLTTPCAPGQDPASDPTRIICQRPFDPERAPPFYRGAMVRADQPAPQQPDSVPPGQRPPTESILPITDAQIDEVAGTAPYLVQQPQAFSAGRIQSTLRAGSVVLPADVFMAFIINNSLGDRPIYFASTTQAYEVLSLKPFLVRQGVALKLHDGPPQADPARGIYEFPPGQLADVVGPYFDLTRTDSLLWNVFLHRGGIPDEWTHWADAPTQGIPFYYAYTHYGAAQAHLMRGDSARAQRHMERAEAWVELGQR